MISPLSSPVIAASRRSTNIHLTKLSWQYHLSKREEDVMERRDFLKIALGAAGGAVGLAATAQAAPLSPHPLVEDRRLPAAQDAHPAVVNRNEVGRLLPEKMRF